jgi:hypothetical protein
MFSDWVPFVTTPVGAALGAGLAYVLDRSRLSVTIDRISISPSLYATSLPVNTNEDLVAAVERSPLPLLEMRDVSAPENTYVTYLELLRQRLVTHRKSADITSRAADMLRQAAAAEDFDKVVGRYKVQQESLWSFAEGEARRGRSIFSRTAVPEDESSREEKYRLHTVDDGYVVELPGTLNLVFTYNSKRPAHSQAVSKALAERIGKAFCHHIRQDLMDFFGAIRDGAEAAERSCAELEKAVDAELRRFARLEIDFLVSNSGRTGVSVGSDGCASVFLRGYAVTTKGAQTATVPQDVSIPLRVMAEQRAEDLTKAARHASVDDLLSDDTSPIVIQPGETVRLLGVSTELLVENPQAQAIGAAYSAAEREFVLRLVRFRQPPFYARRNRGSMRMITSRRSLFRDLRLIDDQMS